MSNAHVFKLLLSVAIIFALKKSTGAAIFTCSGSRSMTSDKFSYIKAARQETSENYVYLTFLVDVSNAATTNVISCGTTLTDLGIQQVEAVIWALENYSKRYPSILSDISVGGIVLNTCNSPALTGGQIGNLERCETLYGGGTATTRVEPGRVFSYIGGFASTSMATSLLPITGGLQKTTISYALASMQFSKSSFPDLVKMSAGDENEVEGLVAFMKSTGIKHVQVLRSAQVRYTMMTSLLAQRMAAEGICLASNELYSAAAIAKVLALRAVRPVFLFLNSEDLRAFIPAAKAIVPTNGNFTWIIPSEHYLTLGSLVTGNEEFMAGTIALHPYETEVADFNTYYRNLKPDNATHSGKNPWFDDYWMAKFSCNLPGRTGYPKSCGTYSDPNNLKAATIDPSSYSLIRSVDLFVHALKIARDDACGSTPGMCLKIRNDDVRFRLLNEAIYKVTTAGLEVNSTTGYSKTYTLVLKNYQKGFPGYAWTDVRTWTSGSLNVVMARSIAAYDSEGRITPFTVSCDAACQTQCPSNVSTTTTTVLSTTTVATTSVNASVTEARFRRQYWVYALIVCASLGVLLSVFFMIYILMRVLTLPKELKNFTTLWLGQLLLLSLLVGYVLLYAWCTWPTPAFCGILRFMVGVVYASIFAILLIKLLILLTNNTLPTLYQVLLYVMALSVQVAISAEWIILVPPQVTIQAGDIRTCNHTFQQHLQSLVYCMALILLCTIVAIRAHNIGKNNREAIFVGVSAGLSIPIWIAWALVGSLNDSIDFKEGSMAFGLFINLTLILLVVFLPKVYQLQVLTIEEDDLSVSEDDVLSNKDPIYMLTTGGGDYTPGEIYLTQDMIADNGMLPQTLMSPTEYYVQDVGKARSVAGQVLPVSYDLVGKNHLPRKAYSDLNFDIQDGSRHATRSLKDVNIRQKPIAEMGYL